MRCPNCGNTDSKVTDSRVISAGVQRRRHDSKISDSRVGSAGVQRRRHCKRCGLRFVTFETHLYDTDSARAGEFSQEE